MKSKIKIEKCHNGYIVQRADDEKFIMSRVDELSEHISSALKDCITNMFNGNIIDVDITVTKITSEEER